MKTGLSVYLGTGFEKNKKILEKAEAAGMTYAFTSLHIPEESVEDYAFEAKRLIEACREHGLELIMDVGPRTLEKLKISSFDELLKLNVTYIRLDYGFSIEEMKELSEKFHIVSNASTLDYREIQNYQSNHFDTSRMAACHNFYPKPLTGISMERVAETNKRLHGVGITTVGFVPGDLEKRGPLFEGLPTSEDHRGIDPVLAMLEMRAAETDIVIIGDVDCKDSTYDRIKELSEDYVTIHADIDPDYSFVMDTVHHDRPDSSEYVIRSQESRGYASCGKAFPARGESNRPLGSISIGNEDYKRYSGELEIARRDLLPESRVNIIGRVIDEDLCLLPYIKDGFGFKLAL